MKKVLIAALCLLLATTLGAQTSYHIRHYDEYDGMAQRYVTQIVQTDDGFIWMGTWNGMDRFDGYEFVNFKSRAGDGSDVVSDRIVNTPTKRSTGRPLVPDRLRSLLLQHQDLQICRRPGFPEEGLWQAIQDSADLQAGRPPDSGCLLRRRADCN